MATEHVLAHVDRRLPALADERDAAPRARGLERAQPALRRAGAVHRRLRALAARQLVDGLHGIGVLGVDDVLGAEPARERQPLGPDGPGIVALGPAGRGPRAAGVSRPETSMGVRAP